MTGVAVRLTSDDIDVLLAALSGHDKAQSKVLVTMLNNGLKMIREAERAKR